MGAAEVEVERAGSSRMSEPGMTSLSCSTAETGGGTGIGAGARGGIVLAKGCWKREGQFPPREKVKTVREGRTCW